MYFASLKYLKFSQLAIQQWHKILRMKTWIDVQKIKYVVESEFQANEFNSDACNESNPRIIDDSRARKLANDLKR